MRSFLHHILAAQAALTIFLATSVNAISKNAEMPLLTSLADDIPLAKKAMSFIDASPDPYHAVQTSVNMLEEAGFEELSDFQPYFGKIRPGRFGVQEASIPCILYVCIICQGEDSMAAREKEKKLIL
eukprot:6997184-Ditylum_brightwellii.AAC.1